MEKTQLLLCFSVSRNQIPDYNPEEENLNEKTLDHVGDFKNLEQVISKLTEKLNLSEYQVESIRKTMIKVEEEAEQQVSPPANPTSKSKRKKMKKQASKLQTQTQLLNAETIEAMKKEISTTVDLLKILQHLHKVLFPARVGARHVRAAARNKISGLVRDGNIICEQARLRKHVGNRWE